MQTTRKGSPAEGNAGPGRLHVIVFALLFIINTGCGKTGQNGHEGVLTIAGSTSVQPFAEKIAEAYMASHPGISINVQGGGSTAGVKAAETGAAQIGMSSRHLKKEEEHLRQFTIAYDGIAIIVNAANPVQALTREQVAAIFAGEVTGWDRLGGAAHPIHFVTREEGSGTRGAFEVRVTGCEPAGESALAEVGEREKLVQVAGVSSSVMVPTPWAPRS